MYMCTYTCMNSYIFHVRTYLETLSYHTYAGHVGFYMDMHIYVYKYYTHHMYICFM